MEKVRVRIHHLARQKCMDDGVEVYVPFNDGNCYLGWE